MLSSSPLRKVYTDMVAWFRSHPPEHAVRGATIGMFAAFTPTIGIQIPILVGLRLVLARHWDFSLPVAIGCTFVTNVFTFAPIYYLFVVTGRVMLGRFDELGGFETFLRRLDSATPDNAGFFEGIWLSMVNILDTFGLPMLVGCLPWAFLVALLTYFVTSRLVR